LESRPLVRPDLTREAALRPLPRRRPGKRELHLEGRPVQQERNRQQRQRNKRNETLALCNPPRQPTSR